MYVKCHYQKGREMRTTTIQARINPDVKAEAQKIFEKLNISMSEAISLYFTQVALHKGIPFKIKIPNDLTVTTIQNAENGIETQTVNTVEELFEELES